MLRRDDLGWGWLGAGRRARARDRICWAMSWLGCWAVDCRRAYCLTRALSEWGEIPPAAIDVTVRPATAGDLELFRDFVPGPRIGRFARKLAAGEVCFLVLAEQADAARIVGFAWAAFAGSPTTVEDSIRLGPRQAYLWGGYVLPEFRRHGIITILGHHLRLWLQEQGYGSVVLFVLKRNKAMLAHCLKQGYTITAEVSFVKVLGRRVWERVLCDPPAAYRDGLAVYKQAD